MSRPADPNASRGEVLVVDDDDAIRDSLSMLLGDAGYTVYEAPDGMSGLERLRTHRSKLVVLLDWQMPGMDGIQVLQAMAEDAPLARRHRFIMLTANARDARRKKSDFPPDVAVRILAKPFEADQLLSIIADEARAGDPPA